MFIVQLLFGSILTSCLVSSKFSCNDANNNVVDWYTIYKLPKLSSSAYDDISQGYAHFYMDDTVKDWKLASNSLASSGHSLFNTLAPVYDAINGDNKDFFYMMYNDEWPDGSTSGYRGHTKGVIAFDSTGGFWLVHSVPKFPPTDHYDWPENAVRYGQSGICITFNYDQLTEIANQLMYTQPWTYASNLPDSYATKIPNLSLILAGKTDYGIPHYRIASLTSAGGRNYTNIVKNRKWEKELYFDLVAPSLKVSLDAETWQNGQGDLGPMCGTYKVSDVSTVKLPDDVEFSIHNDHSKWAVSTDADNKWVCVGDINRQHGQLARGGGTMCFKDSNVWTNYFNSVASVNSC